MARRLQSVGRYFGNRIQGLALLLGLLVLLPTVSNAQTKTVHVFVALCDNENQGIVPVPAKIGNGQDPHRNLYWGAGYGVKNYFKRKSKDWTLIATLSPSSPIILERLLFKHVATDTYLLAEAYDGAYIKQCTIDFLQAASGANPMKIAHKGKSLVFGGGCDLAAYTGHNGLMDFRLDISLKHQDEKQRDVIILACAAIWHFEDYLKNAGAYPLVWTTGLMAPEAYTLEWALDGWVIGESNEQIRARAADAYSHYHKKCSFKAAKRLLQTGW